MRIFGVLMVLVATSAYADVGANVPEADAGTAMDAGAYPDTGCADGLCCVVLPDWDAGMYDAGPVDTGQRRRRPRADAGVTPPEPEGGCSVGGAASWLWLLPVIGLRRRRR